MVPLVFFLNFTLWILAVSFFSVFSSYNGIMSLAIGSTGVFFLECLYRVVYYLPVCLSLALVTVFFFLMRHRTIYWITVLLLLISLIVTIFLIMPVSYRLIEKNSWAFLQNRSVLTSSSRQVYSPGVLRPDIDGSRMVWLSVHESGKIVRRLVVARTSETNSALVVYPEATYNLATRNLVADGTVVVKQGGGEDPLFSNVFSPPQVVALVANRVDVVMDAFLTAVSRGFYSYALFSLVFFGSVTLLWLLCNATGWRLLNILLTFAALFYLYAVYPLFSHGSLVLFALRILPSRFPSEMIPSLFYATQAVLFAIIGAIVFTRRLIRLGGRRDEI